MIIAMAFLTAGFTGILALISNFVFGSMIAGGLGAIAAAMIAWLWFGVPLKRLRDLQRLHRSAAG